MHSACNGCAGGLSRETNHEFVQSNECEVMRWAVKDARGIDCPHTDRDRAIKELRNLRAKAPPGVSYRLVRLVPRSERLQRELDDAREVLEQERRAHAQDMAEARSALGEAWCATDASLADGIRAKTGMLEQAIFDERRRVAAQVAELAAQVERATIDERRRIVEALIRCSREDLPAEVCALAREGGLSLDGLNAIDRRIAIREYAAILARWVARGCP